MQRALLQWLPAGGAGEELWRRGYGGAYGSSYGGGYTAGYGDGYGGGGAQGGGGYGQGGRGNGGSGYGGQQGPAAPVGAVVPRYGEKDDVGGAGGDDQVVGRGDRAMDGDRTDAIEQGVKGGVEALVPADVLDDVVDDRDDSLGFALDGEVGEALSVEDVEGVMSDTFVAGALLYATAAGGRGTGELSARTAEPGRAARELEELVEATAAAPGVPREEGKELELREALVRA